MSAAWSLLALNGPLAGRLFELSEKVLIGRDPTCTVCLADSSISRRHCTIEPAGEGGPILRDTGSRNGVRINEQPVSDRELEEGDVLRLAHFELRVVRREPRGAPADLSLSDIHTTTVLATAPLTLQEGGGGEGLSTATFEESGTVRTLLEISELGSGVARSRDVAQGALRRASDLLGASGAAVALLERDAREVRSIVAISSANEPLEIPRELVEQVQRDAVAVHARVEGVGGQHLLVAPLIACRGAVALVAGDDGDPAEATNLRLLTLVSRVLDATLAQSLQREQLELDRARLEHALHGDIVGECTAMRELFAQIDRAAATESTVLLLGESGTGKELAARALHAASARSDGPFVAINCATLGDLLESELFGHERGAFTGAVERREGKLDAAHGGTLFLDEVGELPTGVQAKLLRVLENRTFDRVGGSHTHEVDARIVAATNRDLEAEIENGTFRRDLFYRLHVISLTLPPLRDRGGDLELVTRHLLGRLSERLGKPEPGITPAAMEALRAHDWPGNVRELSNALERALVLGQGTDIVPEDLPAALLERAPSSGDLEGYHEQLNQTKRDILLTALRAEDGNFALAAKRLGLQRTYLHRLVTKLGLRDLLDAAE